jgi:HEPN domain-containing protein
MWMNAAKEHLLTAKIDRNPVRVRCFHGQRCVELSLKAVLIHHGIEFPLTHTLAKLIELVPVTPPDVIHEAAGLTPYAVEEMYPDTFTDLDADHAAEAVELALAVLTWAESVVEPAT